MDLDRVILSGMDSSFNATYPALVVLLAHLHHKPESHVKTRAFREILQYQGYDL